MLKVVKISFFDISSKNNRGLYTKVVGKPLLEVQVLGTHTFEDVGNILFSGLLQEIRGEELNEHVWYFSPNAGYENDYDDDVDDSQRHLMYLPDVPLLGDQMALTKQQMDFEGAKKTKVQLTQGMELLFTYDLGTTILLLATIDSITDTSPTPSKVYPSIFISDNDALTIQNKLIQINSLPVRTIRMDQAYPNLKVRLFDEHGVSFNFGHGGAPSEEAVRGGKDWGSCFGGGMTLINSIDGLDENTNLNDVRGLIENAMANQSMPAYTTSIIVPTAFEDIDEFFQCLEEGIGKQMGEGHPSADRMTKYTDKVTGTVREVVNGDGDAKFGSKRKFTVHLYPYPSSFPTAEYKSEWHYNSGGSEKLNITTGNLEKVITFTRWSFSFALSPNWKDNSSHTFSFANQFPKCAKWLTHDTDKYYWMLISRKKLFAFNRKAGPKTKPCFETIIKHTSIHDMFAEMEVMLELPKAWNAKKAKK